ncbi:MAG: ComEC/Rec2 family competence protein [Lachnospiraceae bacterium]|jgi:competence protein ComEC
MKKIKGFLLTIVVFLLCGCQQDISSQAEETDTAQVQNLDDGSELEVHYIDVGQGDASLILLDGHAMLIDGGNNNKGELVRDYLISQGVEFLDYIVATHPDADHIGGLDVVMQHFDTGLFLYPDYEKDTMTYDEVIEEVKQQNLDWSHPVPGDSYALGDASFTILAPRDHYPDANNNSIVLMLEYGENRFLFTADAEIDSMEDMLQAGEDLEANVYKMNHHGSAMAFTQEFLEAVDPQYAVISCGEGNSYGHPHWEVLSALDDDDVIIYRTDQQGTLVAVSDGSTIRWNTLGSLGSETEEAVSQTYIINRNTGKYHLPDCPSVSSIKAENREEVKATAEELKAKGYSPCGNCRP